MSVETPTTAKDWIGMADDLRGAIKEMRGGIPAVAKAFSALAAAATAPAALDVKTKELIAIGIAIAARCDGCITFHVKAAVDHGATREEIMETVGMAIYMGGGPSMIYGSLTVEAFDQYVAAKAATE